MQFLLINSLFLRAEAPGQQGNVSAWNCTHGSPHTHAQRALMRQQNFPCNANQGPANPWTDLSWSSWKTDPWSQKLAAPRSESYCFINPWISLVILMNPCKNTVCNAMQRKPPRSLATNSFLWNSCQHFQDSNLHFQGTNVVFRLTFWKKKKIHWRKCTI